MKTRAAIHFIVGRLDSMNEPGTTEGHPVKTNVQIQLDDYIYHHAINTAEFHHQTSNNHASRYVQSLVWDLSGPDTFRGHTFIEA